MASFIKGSIFLLSAISFLGFSYGAHISAELSDTEDDGSNMDLFSRVPQEVKVDLENPVAYFLQRSADTQRSLFDSLTAVSTAMKKVLTNLQEFAPYLSKLAKPFITLIMQLLEKGQAYFVEYVHSLSPATVKNFQTALLSFFEKLSNIDLIKTVVKFAFGGNV